MDIEAYNAAWLQAWTDKDTEKLLTFYGPDVIYKDNQTAAGIHGHAALAPTWTGSSPPPHRCATTRTKCGR